MGQSVTAMSTTLLPRDCYRPHELRRLLGKRDDDGRIVPVSRMTITRLRRKGVIEFMRLNSRVILYSRESVDNYLRGASTHEQ